MGGKWTSNPRNHKAGDWLRSEKRESVRAKVRGKARIRPKGTYRKRRTKPLEGANGPHPQSLRLGPLGTFEKGLPPSPPSPLLPLVRPASFPLLDQARFASSLKTQYAWRLCAAYVLLCTEGLATGCIASYPRLLVFHFDVKVFGSPFSKRRSRHWG